MERFRVRDGLPVQRPRRRNSWFSIRCGTKCTCSTKTSAAIWEGVQDGLDLEKIAGRLGERYDLGGIPDPRALILATLEELAGKGILERDEPGDGGAREGSD